MKKSPLFTIVAILAASCFSTYAADDVVKDDAVVVIKNKLEKEGTPDHPHSRLLLEKVGQDEYNDGIFTIKSVTLTEIDSGKKYLAVIEGKVTISAHKERWTFKKTPGGWLIKYRHDPSMALTFDESHPDVLCVKKIDGTASQLFEITPAKS